MRITKRVRAVVTALALAAGRHAASAGSGVAAPPPPGRLAAVEIVKVEANVGDFWELSASCPMGRVAIGGGAGAGFGEIPHGHDLNLISSRPMVEDGRATGWVVSAHHLWDDIPWTVTAYAIRAAPPAGYQVLQSDPVRVPQKEVARLTCPTGKVVLGGGGTVAPGDWAGISKSYPASPTGSGAPDQWAVGGYGDGATTATTAFAICADPITGLTVRRSHTTEIEYEPYGGLLKCPAGTSVVGGGASANGPAASLYASRPAETGETGSQDGWWAQATDDQSDSTMDLYDMCAQTVWQDAQRPHPPTRARHHRRAPRLRPQGPSTIRSARAGPSTECRCARRTSSEGAQGERDRKRGTSAGAVRIVTHATSAVPSARARTRVAARGDPSQSASASRITPSSRPSSSNRAHRCSPARCCRLTRRSR
ncbi:hypothetical protein SNE510_55540 [Streptomyces sp. NE5-10]|uniref:hypothetical protein n=1 Tax=Streptomyces sp. NE5-10 TaxID=2759674 RepID=UPI001907FEA6|nr:hypothetical protein [Streptomyces sp. NE5-10]GHJ96035.1 hypothetical protein SNE510_55540 [Streptomyces sp. NE5-10]